MQGLTALMFCWQALKMNIGTYVYCICLEATVNAWFTLVFDLPSGGGGFTYRVGRDILMAYYFSGKRAWD